MALSGEENIHESLTSILDAKKLPRLCRDLLTCRGHDKVQVTDGPGDGGRDINSIVGNSQRYLTQCKFHGDPNRTCSSSELSQVPMAMMKLNYKNGLFITNARISPQGKREYLDNYSDFNMEYLDGNDLVAEILSNPLLKALWFDGEHFSIVNTTTIFPALVRIHEKDIPYSFFSSRNEEKQIIDSEYLAEKYSNNQFYIKPVLIEAVPFDPYRAPEPLTMREGGLLPILEVMEIVVEGSVELSLISQLIAELCILLLGNLDEDFDGVSVRIGTPYISPLSNKSDDIKIPTQFKARSYLKSMGEFYKEEDWFSPTSKHWSSECDARVSETEAVRLYAADINCCLAYEVLGRMSTPQLLTQLSVQEIQLDNWEKSLFFLIPQWDEWEHKSIPEPDQKVIWPWDGRVLCGWLHHSLDRGIVPFRSSFNEDSFIKIPDEAIWEEHLEKLKRELLELKNIDLVSPDHAHHMLGLLDADPFTNQRTQISNTAYMIAHPETIPSPISPTSRIFRASIAWKIDIEPGEIKSVISEFAITEGEILCMICACKYQNGDLYIEFHLKPCDLPTQPTSYLIDKVYDFLQEYLGKFESKLSQHSVLVRNTAEYWYQTHNVRLGVPIEDTEKAVWWAEDEGGDITALNATGKPVPVDTQDLDLIRQLNSNIDHIEKGEN